MAHTMAEAVRANFLGNSPTWYKLTIIAFLVVNPFLVWLNPFVAGWALVLEFIFTLAMALKCYPLQPGGLLAVQGIVLGLATPEAVFHEAEVNFPVIMLLMFMVAGIYFLREMLLYTFSKILLGVRSKMLLSLMFSFTAAFLSAFLDALTVTAVIITVAVGFYGVYHKVASGKKFHHDDHDASSDHEVIELHREDLAQFRQFLRSLMMHAAVGTALGGVTTLVGEPQNLLIAEVMDWEFVPFFMQMAHISMPVLVAGLITCAALEKIKIFGYGTELSDKVRTVLQEYDDHMTQSRSKQDNTAILMQGLVAVVLVIALGLHLAEPGVVGLLVIVLATAFNGITEEHRIGHAFEEALPFTALLVVFFAIVAVIHEQHLFSPVIDYVMTYDGKTQEALFFIANGLLSMISDNVFVATVYIGEVDQMFQAGELTRPQFEALAVAINTGTNIPSVATPNGQAAFLFLLTSALAPLIRLSYGRMVIMAVPYTIVMSITGLAALWYLG
ncbi:MAG: sodium/proton antiporter NhaB [Woeseiaceae bacterium]|nr:sodium/proton antiporter NhaB [Woeseiaceae bacterium]